MAQSLSRLHVHTIFSTKDRRRVFRTREMRDTTAAYLTGILKNMDCTVIRINVVVDHVHILHLHPRTRTVADVVGGVKRDSSSWIKDQKWARGNSDFAQFGWQGGYGVFSVSESQVARVVDYINDQMEHHKRITFEDEFRKMLQRHNVQFDERYVWE